MWVITLTGLLSLPSCMLSVCPAPPLSPTSLPKGETQPSPVHCTPLGQHSQPGWVLLALRLGHTELICLKGGVEKICLFFKPDLFTFNHVIALPDSSCCYGSMTHCLGQDIKPFGTDSHSAWEMARLLFYNLFQIQFCCSPNVLLISLPASWVTQANLVQSVSEHSEKCIKHLCSAWGALNSYGVLH